MRNLTRAIFIVGAAAFVAVGGAHASGEHGDHNDHAHEASHEEQEAPRGEHGGRLLRDDGFALEVTIHERGIPPEFRVYAYQSGRALDPSVARVEIELRRLGEEPETIRFRAEGGYLVGDRTVREPHSFDVIVTAEHAGHTSRWEYSSHEERLHLAREAQERGGIRTAEAGPRKVEVRLGLYGRVAANEDRVAHVVARFPGVLKEVRKRLGNTVAAGETLAIVESNESLKRYDVRAEIGGTVIEKHATVGEVAGDDDVLYLIADLSTVWVDLDVYRHDFSRLRRGQRVWVDSGEGMPKGEGQVEYLSPLGAAGTQTMLARVVLPNPRGDWRPGMFVTADVVVDESEVPVAVRAEALQRLRDWTVVFVKEGDDFEARPVQTGRSDGEWVEIVSGLGAGRQYVAGGSFVLKAELGKASAAHEH